jgi:hypothetical protein
VTALVYAAFEYPMLLLGAYQYYGDQPTEIYEYPLYNSWLNATATLTIGALLWGTLRVVAARPEPNPGAVRRPGAGDRHVHVLGRRRVAQLHGAELADAGPSTVVPVRGVAADLSARGERRRAGGVSVPGRRDTDRPGRREAGVTEAPEIPFIDISARTSSRSRTRCSAARANAVG